MREILVGAVSSTIFALIHNITDSGIDTKRIPAGQATGGAILWYLQRKFGLPVNTIAHTWSNARTVIEYNTREVK